MENQTDELTRLKRNAVIHFRAAVLRLILLAVSVVFVSMFILGIKVIETNDMFPKIHAGDLVFFIRFGDVRRNDVVVYDSGNGINIGRIQAVENDLVGVTDKNELTINGNIQPVQKRAGLFYRTYAGKGGKTYPLMLKADEFFILGDERESAEDSRKSGPVSRQEIKGKVFMTIRRRSI